MSSKSGPWLLPLLFKTNLGVDMNSTNQVLGYTNDVYLIGDGIRIERNSDMLLNACKVIGSAVNVRKPNYVFGT